MGGRRETEEVARAKSIVIDMVIDCLDPPSPSPSDRPGGYVQDGELARLERQNREQGEADDEAGQGGEVEGTEDQQSIPAAHCLRRSIESVAFIPVVLCLVCLCLSEGMFVYMLHVACTMFSVHARLLDC